MTKSPPELLAPVPGMSRQRGVVLFIALIVMVAMSLAAISLMRSVDTTTGVIGNLAFRQASILPANFAIEDAAAGLFDDANPAFIARIPDVRLATPNQNYYPTHDPTATGWDDPQTGVPGPLQTQASVTAYIAAGARAQTDNAGNRVTYVIERMCNPFSYSVVTSHAVDPNTSGPDKSWCDVMPPKGSTGTTINDPSGLAGLNGQPFYRVTVRVDGPPGTNAVSFVQAMLR